MQITETVSEGLRREFKIVVDAADLDARLTGRIEEMKPQVHLKGFRPGKAPTSHLKKSFGKSMMGEIVEAVVSEIEPEGDHGQRAEAGLPAARGTGERARQGRRGQIRSRIHRQSRPDAGFRSGRRLQAQSREARLRRHRQGSRRGGREAGRATCAPIRARGEGEAAEKNDQVVIDFVGKVDGEEFPGGKAEDFNLVLGSGQLIPGFEDQLIGAKAGDARDVNVTFPADYPETKLAGKDAVFATTVKEVKTPDPLEIDNALAQKLGLDSIGTLKDRVRDQLKADFGRASRMHLKRRILDALDEAHSFSLPPTMVEGEFDAIWRAVEAELQREGKTAEDEGKSEEELKKEYHDIAERRVRLGLVLARIGEQNGITIANDEIQRAIMARARQFPGQEQQVFNFYANNPQAQAEIRAPLFEDKVVDFIAELAEVTEKPWIARHCSSIRTKRPTS